MGSLVMGIREDLVASAITFLKDPSVARAPLEKRIAFLQSKNLTQEEIDVSLARADDGASVQNASAPDSYARQNQPLTGQPPPYGYGPYPSGYWQQTSPQLRSKAHIYGEERTDEEMQSA